MHNDVGWETTSAARKRERERERGGEKKGASKIERGERGRRATVEEEGTSFFRQDVNRKK